MHTYIHRVYIYIYVYIILTPDRSPPGSPRRAREPAGAQDSSKGGVVETGCSGLHYITH